jgi:sterol desaturase/sphingolipid hydroxylase (fatty acid hydroxylase superfamily)
MPLFRMEHTARENAVDLAVQVATILLLAGLLTRYEPDGRGLSALGLVLSGLMAWTLVEYCVHRFVLHGLRPWRTWHAQHHSHPLDHVFAPTLLISALFAALVFAPALWLGGLWIACAFTAGVMGGYLIYSLTHLAIHHRSPRGAWLRQRQRWHAEHHRQGDQPGRYGVTTGFWDRLFDVAGKLSR